MADIHSERFVKSLFDEMAKTYGLVNMISSLGFAYVWRRRTVYSLQPDNSRPFKVCDMMAGGAECLSHIKRRFGTEADVHLVDWCENMCEHAGATVDRQRAGNCSIIYASALSIPVPESEYDAIVSTFGLKTLAPDETDQLAREINRTLKSNGSFSILEFSIPPNPFIRFFFRIYVAYYVPLLGWLFLGNPENYRMLWRYTCEFSNCRNLAIALEREGFSVSYRSHFFGSATQLVGRRRDRSKINPPSR